MTDLAPIVARLSPSGRRLLAQALAHERIPTSFARIGPGDPASALAALENRGLIVEDYPYKALTDLGRAVALHLDGAR